VGGIQSGAATTDDYLAGLPGWQARNLSAFRELVCAASPEISEEIKWGVPCFVYKKKTAFSMASFKEHTKFNFMHNGAELDDAAGLFNNGLDSKKSRSIDLREGDALDTKGIAALLEQSLAKI
jgi:hypothetical protein